MLPPVTFSPLPFSRRAPEPEPRSGPARATPATPPLPWVEAALVAVTAAHLCFLPWALGAMNVWSQLASLGAALAGFGLAALPRTPDGRLFDTTQVGR